MDEFDESIIDILDNVTVLISKASHVCNYSGAPKVVTDYGAKLLDNATELLTKNATDLLANKSDFCDSGTPEYIAKYGGDVHSFDDEVIMQSFKIFGAIYVMAFFSFCIARIKLPRYFNIRSWVPELKCELAFQEYGFFSWFWKVHKVPDDQILEQCGMDALCFIRVMKFLRKLAVFGCFNAIYLLPIYATAPKSPETMLITDKLAMVTTANVPSYSHRFLATVVAAYLIFIYTMYNMLEEFRWFTKYRHKFLIQHRARNYAVYVSGVPEQYRSSYALLDYFRKCSSTSAVVQAEICHDLPKLETKCKRRDAVIGNIEAAREYERLKGKSKTYRRIKNKKMEVVETEEAMQKELAGLNKEISIAINKIMNTNDRMRSKFRRSQRRTLEDSVSSTRSIESDEEAAAAEPTSKRSLKDMIAFSQSTSNLDEDGEDQQKPVFFSTSQMRTEHETDSEELNDDTEEKEANDEEKGIVGGGKGTTNNGYDVVSGEEELEDNSEMRRQRKVRFTAEVESETTKRTANSTLRDFSDSSLRKMDKAVGDISETAKSRALEHGKKGIKMATDIGSNALKSTTAVANFKAVGIYVGLTEGYARRAGFVIFSDLYTKQAALQMVHHPAAGAMEVWEAPDPKRINWNNVGLPANALLTGWLVSWGATIALCLFWWIPVMFITSLTNVNSLKLQFPKLEEATLQYPWLEMGLAQVAPVLLIWLRDLILPEVLKYFSTWEGHISFADVEAALFTKLAAFMIFQTFFITLISGSIGKNLLHMLNNPSLTINFLAISLPAEYIMFIQILLADACFIHGFELLRGYPLGIALMRRFIGPNRTPKERRTTYIIFHSLEDPPDFYIARNLAVQLLFFMIFFVYSTIAPVISFIMVVCLFVMESGFRYHFYHNHHKDNDSGGKTWIGFAKIALVNMMIAEIALTGMLVLKNSVYALPFMVPLILGSAYFVQYVNKNYYHKTYFLPTSTCLEVDEMNRENEAIDTNFAVGEYIQPCLKHRLLYPESTD